VRGPWEGQRVLEIVGSGIYKGHPVLLGGLVDSEIGNTTDPGWSRAVDSGNPDQNRHAGPVLPEDLLLKRGAISLLRHLGHRCGIQLGVFGWRHLCPAQQASL
jgi:hypothetical protein